MPDLPGGSTRGYAAQLDSLRSTAKWLVAAFAGVAVILVGGLRFSDIGTLSPSAWRFYAAIGSASVALAAVGYMIREASVVLTHDWLTLATFSGAPDDGILRSDKPSKKDLKESAQLQKLERQVENSRHELFGYAAPSLAQLHAQLQDYDEQIWHTKPNSRAAYTAQLQAALLRHAAHDAVQYANYYATLKLFQRMRSRLGWAAGIVVISVGVFAYSATLPVHHNSPTPARTSTGPLQLGPRPPNRLTCSSWVAWPEQVNTHCIITARGLVDLHLGGR